MNPRWILVTGATGLIGGAALREILHGDSSTRAFVLVRDLRRWSATTRRLNLPADRVTPLKGDLTIDGLGLGRQDRTLLAGRVRSVVHAAADTSFSQPLPEARRINVDGTCRLLDLALDWPGFERFGFVSTAFVAGRRVGWVPEIELDGQEGWVNAYERSKHEAEAAVRQSGLPYAILRSSTVVCDSERGSISQINAVHRALCLYHAGLASLLPGEDATPIDVVPLDYVSSAVAELATDGHSENATYHLCAGQKAMRLGELLDRCQRHWSKCEEWRSRGIARPALTDLDTYRLFERSVQETGDAQLRRIARALSHFVPQLALPKTFDTARADTALGRSAPPVRSYWDRMLAHLTPACREATSRPRAVSPPAPRRLKPEPVS